MRTATNHYDRKRWSCEATMANDGIADPRDWLARAHQACTKVQQMIDSAPK
jgi:hypothetical protein